jgi:non-heme chloroperoxidase
MIRRQLFAAALAAPALVAGTTSHAALSRNRVAIETRDGTHLFHRKWGSGPPVLFVSSWTLSSSMWTYQVAHLGERGMRCITFDRRGHGRSDTPPHGYDLDTLADDLGDVITSLGLHDVVLVGHSMGCAEIINYLDRHGTDRVRKIALLAPAAPYLTQSANNPYGAPQDYHEATMAKWAQDFPGWVEENKVPFFTPDTSTAMMDWLAREMLQTPSHLAITTFRTLISRDLRPSLAKINRQTLVIHGDKDASVPMEIGGQRVAAGIKGAELKIYKGAPHGLFITHMGQVNRDLEAFIMS